MKKTASAEGSLDSTRSSCPSHCTVFGLPSRLSKLLTPAGPDYMLDLILAEQIVRGRPYSSRPPRRKNRSEENPSRASISGYGVCCSNMSLFSHVVSSFL